MSSLEDRVALVTGASRGIGAAIARLFAARGARVAVAGRDEAALASVVAEIERAGGRAARFSADVTRLQEIERLRAEVERDLGPVDILIANAGGSFEPPCAIEDATERGWHASIDGNLTATFFTLKVFLPGMKQRGRGSIVTVSSAAARRASVRNPIAYAAAKAGIETLTRIAALQAGPSGVRVNCVAPETILTERNVARIPDAMKSTLADDHPLKRLGAPEDVAEAALYLASDASSWVTGVVLDVAGGSVLAS
ncbi:MAG TPA: SDR family NAD(P)-dependent oxidoreductase [Polyangiaceae bacterium]|jgi:3-oxoacyl-[acyl-carrier protein] reductase